MAEFLARLRIYAGFVRPFRAHLALIAALLVLNAVLDTLSMVLLMPVISMMTEPQGTASAGLQQAYALMARAGVSPSLYLFLVAFLAVMLLRNACRYAEAVFRARVQCALVKDAAGKIFDNLMDCGYAFFHSTRKGDILNYVNSGASNLMFVLFHLLEIALNMLLIACYGTMLFLLAGRLTLLVAAISLLGLLTFRPLLRRTKRLSRRQVETCQRSNSIFVEVLDGIKMIKAYGAEAFERGRLRAEHGRFMDELYGVQKTLAQISISGSTFGFVVIIVLFLLARGSYHLPFAVLSVYFLMLYRMIPMVQRLPHQFGQLMNTLAPVELALEAVRRDNKPYISDGTQPFAGLQRDIAFDRVSFRYLDQPVLQEVSLTIRSNATTAIIGATGSGKTTMLDLLLRLYDPQAGDIRLDGVPLRQVRLADWRRCTAVVLQDSFLFNDTVANNIRYGREGLSEADIRAAAVMANADGLISALPQGYGTMLGERGVTLSGGQKQMVALARALVRRPQLLILDEATSSLDSASERMVQQALGRLQGRLTMVVIAHRLATVQHADHLVVLDRGRVVESGDPALLRQRPDSRYAQYLRLQQLSGESSVPTTA